MTKRKMPPGRRSISQSTVVHGAGVNHFLTCSGVVHALQTSSRGTSTTRSRTRSSLGSKNRSEEHTSELQSRSDLVCRLLLEKKNSKFFSSNYCSLPPI